LLTVASDQKVIQLKEEIDEVVSQFIKTCNALKQNTYKLKKSKHSFQRQVHTSPPQHADTVI
jgi:hypothetical protein